MAEFFINYRTGDEENVAALLEHELSRRFESGVFFRASKSITPGDDYEQELVTAVRRSVAVLAVIGPRWLEVNDEQKRRKIDNPSDWTRREILAAFEGHVRVIPVLVGTARPLAAKDLPPALSELAVCQYVRLRSRDLEPDLDHLALQLTKLVPELSETKLRNTSPVVAAAGAAMPSTSSVGLAGNFVDGREIEAGQGETLDVRNPATGDVIARIPIPPPPISTVR